MSLRDPSTIHKANVNTWDVFLQYTDFYWNKPVTWFSWLIRKFTKSVYNHTSEALWISGRLYMIESISPGITIRDRETWANTKVKKTVKHIRMHDFDSNFNTEEYTLRAMLQLDKKYDVRGIPKLFLMIVFGYWKNISEEKSKECLWCSEFTALMKELPGRQKYLPRDFDNNPLFFEVI